MTGLIRSELRKMLTVRGTYLLAGGAVAVALLTVFAGAGQDVAEGAKPLREQQSWLFTSLLTRLLFVLLGLRIVTEEYRYRTLTPTLLASGSRLRLLMAKSVAAAGGAVVLALLAQLVLVAAATVSWAQRDVTLLMTAADARAMAGMAAAAVAYATLGVGLGFVIRQPVPAAVGAVVWLLLGEDVLQVRFGDAVAYLPGYAGLALSVGTAATGSSSLLLSAAALVGWTAAAVLAAAVLLRRRDVA